MKKLIATTLAIALLICLAGCSSTQYKDTNGPDDFSLQTITDDDIIHLTLGASGMVYEETSLADVITSSEYHSKNFNGVERIYETTCLLPSDISVYIGHMDVKSGNFKLVAVNEDQIIHEFDPDAFGETFLFEDLKGSFSIIAAGESAAFSFYLDVQ